MKTIGAILSILFFDCLIKSSISVGDKEATDSNRPKDLKEEAKDSIKHFLGKYPSGPESFLDVIDQIKPNPMNDNSEKFQSYDDFTFEGYDLEIDSTTDHDGQKNDNAYENSRKKFDIELMNSDSSEKGGNNVTEITGIFSADQNRFYEAPEKFVIVSDGKHSIDPDQYHSPYDYDSYSSVDANQGINTKDTVDSSNTHINDKEILDYLNVEIPDLDTSQGDSPDTGTKEITYINRIAGINTTSPTRISALSAMELNVPEKFNIGSVEALSSGTQENYRHTSETLVQDDQEEDYNVKTFKKKNSSKKKKINLQIPENFSGIVTEIPESFQLEPSYSKHSSKTKNSGISFLQKNIQTKTSGAGLNWQVDDNVFANGTDNLFIEINEKDQEVLSGTDEHQIYPGRTIVSNKRFQNQPTPNPSLHSEEALHQWKHELKNEEFKADKIQHVLHPYPEEEKSSDRNGPSVYESMKYIFSDPKRFFSLINSNENLRATFKIPEYDMGAEGPWTAENSEGFIRDPSVDANYTAMWLKILKTIYQIIKVKSVLEGTETTDIILKDLLDFLEDIESYVENFHDDIECPTYYYRVGNLCLALDFLDSYLDFHEARLFCQIVKGGDLAMFRDANEFAYIQFFLNKIDPSREFSYWIGLTDEVNEGDWRFIDGRTARYGSPFWGVKKMYCPMCNNSNPLLVTEMEDEKYPYYKILQPEIMNKHENYAILMKSDHHYIHDVSTLQAEKSNTIPLCQYIPERDAVDTEDPDIWNELITTSFGNQPYGP